MRYCVFDEMKSFFSHFRGDFFGGITAGIVALPLALAFGVSSGLGPGAGLYGAIIVGFFAALFGGTHTQISGPTAPMTAVSMVVVAGIVALNDGDVSRALPSILTIFMMAGVIQIALGFIGMGAYIKYIPYPVVSGFMTAIGVIILITELLPVVGYYPKDDQAYVSQFKPQAEELILENLLREEAGEGILVLEDFKETIRRAEKVGEHEIVQEAQTLAAKSASGVVGALRVLPRAMRHVDVLEVTLALITIAIIYGFKRITTAVPSTLVALFVVSGAAYGFGLDYRPIEQIPSGLPVANPAIFTQFNLNSVSPYIFTALTLALLGAIDSLLTSVVADNMTKTRHKPNKELIGQGIGNSLSAFFGGLPGAGATIRTVVNIHSGGKTRLSGMIAGLLLLCILLLLGPVASRIPAAVLAGILVTVGVGVIDYRGVRAIPNLPKDLKLWRIKMSSEALVMLTVMTLAAFWNLVYAVGIGLVIASLMFMKRMGDITVRLSAVTPLSKEKAWSDEKGFPAELKEKVFVKHINGPLFFASTNEIQQLSRQIPDWVSTVIIRMVRMSYMDQSGLYALEDILIGLRKKNITVLLVDVPSQPRYMMERIGVIPDLISPLRIFDTFADCMSYIKNRRSDAPQSDAPENG